MSYGRPPIDPQWPEAGLEIGRERDERAVAYADYKRAQRAAKRARGGGPLRRAWDRLRGGVRTEDPPPPAD